MNRQSSKASSDSRRKLQARDPEAFKRKRAVWDKKYQQTHAEAIRARNRAFYKANREREIDRSKAHYAANPAASNAAALRRYYKKKSTLPPGQTELPIIRK